MFVFTRCARLRGGGRGEVSVLLADESQIAAKAAGWSRSRADAYSRHRRSTSSRTGGTSSMLPTPWPAPQISFQALVRPEPKFIEVLSTGARLSGSRPAAVMLALR